MLKTKVMAAWWLAIAVGCSASAQEGKTFHGEISDTPRAMNVHSVTRSHQEMMKSNSMGGTARDCALYCVKYHGGDFVFIHKTQVYRLDDQNAARALAGRKVKIVGEVEPDEKTIHIIKIAEDL